MHNTSIRKITNCDNTIAALSTNGEVFTFTVPAPSDASSGTDRNKGRNTIVPQRVWALRKKVTAVRVRAHGFPSSFLGVVSDSRPQDVALGADGSLIVCTESGHVFVRARVAKAGQGAGTRALKFQQVPYIQRAVRVYANATGSYAALRVEHRPPPIKVAGHTLAQDMAEVQPYMRHRTREAAGPEVNGTGDHGKPPEVPSGPDDQLDEESEDLAIQRDIKQIELLCGVLETMREQGDSAGLYDGRMPFGADLLVQVGSAACEFPAHRVVLAARSAPLRHLLASGTPVQDTAALLTAELLTAELLTAEASASTHAKLGFAGCQPLSVLILLTYLYSDDPPALWDPRVGPAVGRRLVRLGSKPEQVKAELKALARMLQLPLLADVLDAPVKRLPKPSMGGDMRRLFEASQGWSTALARSPDAPDVVLRLADRDVYAHSTILRARSSFFATFFDDEDWTRDRWTPEGTIVVDLKHLRWREMEYVTRFLCCDGDQEMFDVLGECDWMGGRGPRSLTAYFRAGALRGRDAGLHVRGAVCCGASLLGSPRRAQLSQHCIPERAADRPPDLALLLGDPQVCVRLECVLRAVGRVALQRGGARRRRARLLGGQRGDAPREQDARRHARQPREAAVGLHPAAPAGEVPGFPLEQAGRRRDGDAPRVARSAGHPADDRPQSPRGRSRRSGLGQAVSTWADAVLPSNGPCHVCAWKPIDSP